MPSPVKNKYASELGPIPGKRIEDARKSYVELPEDDDRKLAYLKTLLATTIATILLQKSNDPGKLLDDFEFNRKMMEVTDSKAIDLMAQHYKDKPQELLDLLDYEPENARQIYNRCNVELEPENDKFMFMTDQQILEYENELKSKKKIYEKGEKTIAQISEAAPQILQDMSIMPENMQTDAYKKLYDAVLNLTDFGTTDFKYTDENGNVKKANEFTKNHPQLAVRAINDVHKYANEYYKENPAFAKKVLGKLWSAHKQHAEYIDMDPSAYKDNVEKELGVIAKEKQARNIANKFVTPHNDYIQRSEKAMDMYRDVLKGHADNELSFWRGSPEYNNIGKSLRDVHRAWVDMLDKDQQLRARQKQTGKADINEQKALQEKVKRLREQIEDLKEKNQKYFDHKVTDGQFLKGTNSNADKRIAAVDNIDKFADFLLETIERKEKIVENKINDINQQKADELVIEGLPEQNINNLIKNDEVIIEPPKNAVQNNNEEINNNEININEAKDDPIIKEEKIEEPKTDAQKAQEFLDNKRAEAQRNIQNASADGKIPNKEEMRQNYAAIATSFFIQAAISRSDKNKNVNHMSPESLNENLYNTFLRNTLKSKSFKTMMDKTSDKDLFEQASHDKGQNLWSNYDEKRRNPAPEAGGRIGNNNKQVEKILGNN